MKQENEDLIQDPAVMLILTFLNSSDKNGFELAHILLQRSGDPLNGKEGAIYPLLHRLEKEGLVSAYTKKSADGKKRRYYHLSRRGRGHLERGREKGAAIPEKASAMLGLV